MKQWALVVISITVLNMLSSVQAASPVAWDAPHVSSLPLSWQTALQDRISETATIDLLADRVHALTQLLHDALASSELSSAQQEELAQQIQSAVLTQLKLEVDTLTEGAPSARSNGQEALNVTQTSAVIALVTVIKELPLGSVDERREAVTLLDQATKELPNLLHMTGVEATAQQVNTSFSSGSKSKNGWQGPVIASAAVVAVIAVTVAAAWIHHRRSRQKENPLPAGGGHHLASFDSREAFALVGRSVSAPVGASVGEVAEIHWRQGEKVESDRAYVLGRLFAYGKYNTDGTFTLPKDLAFTVTKLLKGMRSSDWSGRLVRLSGAEKYLTHESLQVFAAAAAAAA